jgi:hypothetical protein
VNPLLKSIEVHRASALIDRGGDTRRSSKFSATQAAGVIEMRSAEKPLHYA